MKKLLLLGGSSQQVIAIETAKRLGYYTILCDYLPDNPGQYSADKFYQESTTDKDLILKIATEEKINGIIAYASDPAAPTAAYVAEKLNLPTNPFESVNTLCNKDLFRLALKKNGFAVPQSLGFSEPQEAKNQSGGFNYPVIVKPVDSSGSKGVTVVRAVEDISNAIDFAFTFSRCKRIVIEEYIEKDHPYLIGGDIFVVDGKIKIWGLLNCHRDESVNPLVPVGKSYPLMLTEEQIKVARDTLQKLVTALKIDNGPMNVELVVDKNNRCFMIDAGPRCGGNMIPDLLGMIFDVDIVELCIKLAMGEMVDVEENGGHLFYATHNLHSNTNGIYQRIEFDDEIEKYIIKKCLYKKAGDRIEYFDNAAKALGIIFMKFPNAEEMAYILNNINEHVKVVIK